MQRWGSWDMGSILEMLGLRHRKQALSDVVPYDPKTQRPVIRASICTGERVAGFKDKATGHFTEVMLLRSENDERLFKEAYHLDALETEC